MFSIFFRNFLAKLPEGAQSILKIKSAACWRLAPVCLDIAIEQSLMRNE